MTSPPRLLVLGAHPDDAEYHAGGLISAYRLRGCPVKLISVTNGQAGHHQRLPRELAEIRKREARAAGEVVGADYEVWDFPDGQLQPTLEVRRAIITEIRTFAPDLVLTHRTNDYHPDHRAVGQAVQDASFMVTVPHIVPEIPALRSDPVVASMIDLFSTPIRLRGDVVLDVTPHQDVIVSMLECHASQVFEWLPYNERIESTVPTGRRERREWLVQWFLRRARPRAQRYRPLLIARYGSEVGLAVDLCEVYEISEYAKQLDDTERERLFPE